MYFKVSIDVVGVGRAVRATPDRSYENEAALAAAADTLQQRLEGWPKSGGVQNANVRIECAAMVGVRTPEREFTVTIDPAEVDRALEACCDSL
jgi:hypothetical protein